MHKQSSNRRSSRRHMALLVPGALTLGWLQALGDVDFNQIFFSFLSTFLNLLVSVLLGGDASTLLA